MADEEASSSSTDSNQGEEARAVGEGEEADTATHGGKKWKKSLREVVFPRLTMHKGQEVLSVKKSTVVIVCLYSSHILSSWGDRMWWFVLSLLLALLFPGSLLLPGIYGLAVGLFASMFGTIVGDWVDFNPRMKVISLSLLIQNGLVAISAVILTLMFHYEWNICLKVEVFAVLSTLVILFGAAANLATVANTIAVERDWVVVLADGNEDTLASMNATMRRIDLVCKLLAPATTGVFLQHTGPFTTTIIVATWNVVSFFGELVLIWLVYRMIPTLARKKYRKPTTMQIDEEELDEDASKEKEEVGEGDDISQDSLEDEGGLLGVHPVPKKTKKFPKVARFCSKFLGPYHSLKDGWKIYMRQDIARVGFALAALYLTVLGFSGVTTTYLLTQGLRQDLIGLFQGIGAVFGVTGTLFFPLLRRRFGAARAGLFGISTQLMILLFCGVSVFLSSNQSSCEQNYYSADCSAYDEMDCIDINATTTNTTLTTSLPSSTLLYTTTKIMPTQSYLPNTSYPLPSITPTQSYLPNTSYPLPSITPTMTPVFCSAVPSCKSHEGSGEILALVFILFGIIGARFGLWIFDLAVTQLVQETVVEEERGVVAGVMNAMNSIMDMLQYVMVIAAPRPEDFYILTIISIASVSTGVLIYASYVRKVRGHLFHCRACYRRIRQRKGFTEVRVREEGESTAMVNTAAVQEEEDDGDPAGVIEGDGNP